MEKKEPYQVPILQKGFALMESLASRPAGMTMQEFSDHLRYPKTTIFRLLTELSASGYLSYDPQSAKYTLSRKLLRLGLAALGETNIVEHALGPMRTLRDQIRESVLLGIFMDNRVVLLEQILGSHNFTFLLRPGSDFCLHASAPGKLFLAQLPEPDRTAALQTINYTPFTPSTLCTPTALASALAAIRESGYATDAEEEMEGVNCIAAPIRNHIGEIAAALWTSGPSGRLTQATFPAIAQQLIAAADAISARLGYTNDTKTE